MAAHSTFTHTQINKCSHWYNAILCFSTAHFGGSKRSIRSAEAYSESVDSSNSPTAIIAVTASVLVAVVGVIATAALVTRAWRRHHLPKTIVV